MSWAARRRLIIVLLIFIVLSGFAFYKIYPIVFKPAMCTDNEQNGTELGVDCGGICTNLCTTQVKIPNVLWARSFQVAGDVYNAAAYIENKNNAGTRAIPYEIRLYDKDGIFVTRTQGLAMIPTQGRFAIVETGIKVGATSSIGRTTFEFSPKPVLWEKIPEADARLVVLTNNSSFDDSGVIPKLTTTASNPSSTVGLNDTVFAAILYDKDDNAINVSRTIIPKLAPQEKKQISFTWPNQLTATPVRFDILPIIDVFHPEK